MHTISDMTAVSKPATQRNNRDLQPSPAEEAILHFRKSVRHDERIKVELSL